MSPFLNPPNNYNIYNHNSIYNNNYYNNIYNYNNATYEQKQNSFAADFSPATDAIFASDPCRALPVPSGGCLHSIGCCYLTQPQIQ